MRFLKIVHGMRIRTVQGKAQANIIVEVQCTLYVARNLIQGIQSKIWNNSAKELN